MKLNIGDKVKLVDNDRFASNYIGQIFTVTEDNTSSYSLINDNGNFQLCDKNWDDNCIELISTTLDMSTVFDSQPSYALEKKDLPKEDIVKPKRYNNGEIEVWDYILDQKMDFLEGSIVKYISRYKEKGGLKDLEKAKIYIDKIIKERYSDRL